MTDLIICLPDGNQEKRIRFSIFSCGCKQDKSIHVKTVTKINTKLEVMCCFYILFFLFSVTQSFL